MSAAIITIADLLKSPDEVAVPRDRLTEYERRSATLSRLAGYLDSLRYYGGAAAATHADLVGWIGAIEAEVYGVMGRR